jgi:putative ribosome biogenesis GTPase RsgA
MIKEAVNNKEILLSRYENYVKFLNDKNSRWAYGKESFSFIFK